MGDRDGVYGGSRWRLWEITVPSMGDRGVVYGGDHGGVFGGCWGKGEVTFSGQSRDSVDKAE